ncbi:polysaccharide biosynthesis tyrosine autokinase [Cellulophaga sp. HaHaR_3_176]|uniref:GumC family protein n=1 Tax=Cellulophaga sp. HaHaR_3_176 TaxID=1942464 RepID=UPI001C1F76E7|nr:tyrosine-protein kinase [Cellulophaga sp. HaHaR_3_176]QWX84809.1 polysaccharide biosynthesis tyrosine autokinase [Cellulophaga sp. HaHaR_3_176]
MENTDLKDIIRPYLKKWFWFILFPIITIAVAFMYIRYTVPKYSAEAQIQILEEESSGSTLDVFQDLDLFSGSKNKIEDEIQIIKSRSNITELVLALDLNTKMYVDGTLKDSEIYKNQPIKLSFIGNDTLLYKSKLEFFIELIGDTKFNYYEGEGLPKKTYDFGKNLNSSIGDLVLTPNDETFSKYKGRTLRVVINPLEDVVMGYLTNILVYPTNETSNIINISLTDPIPDKAKDVLNLLIDIYNKNAIADKKEIADKTSQFINDRITDIYDNLASVDQNAQDFKTDKGLTDIASEANINLNVGAANNQELQNTTTQLQIASSMKDIIENQSGYEILPSNIGLSDPSIVSTTAKYNELVSERKRMLKSSNEKNPIIVNLDQELAGLKSSMKSSLTGMTNNLGLQVNSLSNQRSQIYSKIYSAPKNERALRDITRKQQTTESLYLYLLQKREESQITFASSTPKSKIVNQAYSTSRFPVSPKKTLIYLASLILGLLIPFSAIYASGLIDNKIHNKTGLEKVLNDTPVLAELPKLSKKDSKIVLKDDRSVLAESLRILRTNLDYLMKSKKGPGKKNVIYVTSSVSGEGKTFLSSNLSMILANTNKKVLLIGADIRNPKLYSFFDKSDKNVDKLKSKNQTGDLGLTEYLYNDELTSKDITNSLLVHTNTIDVIYSGKIPPNPAELLMSGRLKDLLEESSENYDYVIVDTAPLMVVSDTLIISEYSDHIIYVTRAGMTELDVVNFPLKLQEEGKLNNLCFVVNDVKENNLGYGGKYGYGYGKTLRKWWKF